jgi:serine/threonine protein kinase
MAGVRRRPGERLPVEAWRGLPTRLLLGTVVTVVAPCRHSAGYTKAPRPRLMGRPERWRPRPETESASAPHRGLPALPAIPTTPSLWSMPDVDDSLVAMALTALGVTDDRALRPGGQKAVRLVRRGTERLVMKVIPVPSSTADALRRAEREVELLRSLQDPHVVRVVSDLAELGEPVSGAAWLEEYLDGDDLGSHLGPQWPWEETAVMGLHVARGLAAGHAKSVVHRDLSANNVRRTSDGTYKVMDFGFARHTLRSGLTIAGQPGTPGFLSPEHLHTYSGAPTAASDVFCVGILMFTALAGELPIPWEGDDATYIRNLMEVRVPNLAAIRPDLSTAQVRLVERCLHRQPARRFLNGQRLAEAIEAKS